MIRDILLINSITSLPYGHRDIQVIGLMEKMNSELNNVNDMRDFEDEMINILSEFSRSMED